MKESFMSKIVVMSDFNFMGSGYEKIMSPICLGLHNAGHELKIVGLGYSGQEHNFPYSIIPCQNFQSSHAMVNNLRHQWGAEILIVAIDIPYQSGFIAGAKKLGMKVISVVPLENPPLTPSWAQILQQSDKVFFISQLGADAGKEAGLDCEHLVVGMDTNFWRLRTQDEYRNGRSLFNFSDDTLVVLTVADNQERKNLSKAMEIISKVKHEHKIKVKYILITREHSEVGWKLRDLAMYYKIASDVIIFDRNLSIQKLYAMYAIADVFLLTSKAEGLGLPVMEAMCVGVPVVASDTGAITELLENNRGFLIETEYSHIDPWGNSIRKFPRAEHGAKILKDIYNLVPTTPDHARKYMETRTLDKPISQMLNAIEELNNVKE
jgi:glycosyltransferase involved in cell wall biosynthesis